MSNWIEIPDVKILNLTEASGFLGLTEAEVKKIASKLKAKIIERKYFFLESDLEKFKHK